MRAIATKARYGSRTRRTARRGGAAAMKRGATRQAPARVEFDLVEISGIVEKCEVAGRRSVQRRHARNEPSGRCLGPRLGAGERGDLGNRQRFCALEEQRFGHPTRTHSRQNSNPLARRQDGLPHSGMNTAITGRNPMPPTSAKGSVASERMATVGLGCTVRTGFRRRTGISVSYRTGPWSAHKRNRSATDRTANPRSTRRRPMSG